MTRPTGWWPYGEMAEALVDAVQSKDWDKAEQLSVAIKEEARKRREYDVIIGLFLVEMEACRWENAETLLEKARLMGQVASYDITYYSTMLSFERGETTVLDRLVRATDDD